MARSFAQKRNAKRRLLVWGLCFVLAVASSVLWSIWPSYSQNGERLVRGADITRVEIFDRPVAQVSDRIFGHLLERASWGEPGPEDALIEGTRQLLPAAVERMAQMNIPLMRFPGGTDVDYTDWRDLISNVPGRDIGRPVTFGHTNQEITNQFGLDEYFDLRDELSTSNRPVETILVANFLDAVSKKVPLENAALSAASLVAYANSPIGATPPAGMEDWPAVRAKNGHPEPFGAEYLQIGNELWNQRFRSNMQVGSGLTESDAIAQWYLQCLNAYLDAIDAVDPTIEIIIDGTMGDGIERTVLADDRVRDRVKYVTFHDYAPGPINNLKKLDEPVESSVLGATDWWRAFVAMPGRFNAEGESLAVGDRADFVRSLGYKIAITEWNWNGWGLEDLDPTPNVDWRMASSIGTAGFLNGLIREPDIALACQSLLLGSNWNITSIRVDPDGEDSPYFLPQGHMTLFYSNHHGTERLQQKVTNLSHYPQPFSMGWVGPSPEPEIATLDVVTTADKNAVYVHAVNRAMNRALPVVIDLSDFAVLGESTQHLFTERPEPNWADAIWNQVASIWQEIPQERAQITSNPLPLESKTLTVTLPKQSVSILQINKP